ncbi:unnamed protein product [Adineta steineri]|uniref:Uncharacterized protein n=1 Tax=Adineta steineri TaxID=433720 RepID=A0A813XMA6_9BILA|nr:unnamed protein product [Adineta steineri]CAF0871958.1 unnamed protein product [Adineta steineri]
MTGTEGIAIVIAKLEFPKAPVPWKPEPIKPSTTIQRSGGFCCSRLCFIISGLLLLLLVGDGIAAGLLILRKPGNEQVLTLQRPQPRLQRSTRQRPTRRLSTRQRSTRQLPVRQRPIRQRSTRQLPARQRQSRQQPVRQR